jgi:predicted RND superfamily exporter protein
VIAGLLVVVGLFSHGMLSTFVWMPPLIPLLLENDPDLEFSRQINNRYGTSDSVTVAYTPDGDLFDPAELEILTRLREDLLSIERVESVDSILNVPIFGDTPLTGISEDYLTLLGSRNRSGSGAGRDHFQPDIP